MATTFCTNSLHSHNQIHINANATTIVLGQKVIRLSETECHNIALEQILRCPISRSYFGYYMTIGLPFPSPSPPIFAHSIVPMVSPPPTRCGRRLRSKTINFNHFKFVLVCNTRGEFNYLHFVLLHTNRIVIVPLRVIIVQSSFIGVYKTHFNLYYIVHSTL